MGKRIDITMPADHQEGTTATIAHWLNEVGDEVDENEPIAEVETDKVNVEIAAPVTGVLVEIVEEEGAVVTPGQIIGRIEIEGEDGEEEEPAPKAAAAPQETVQAESGKRQVNRGAGRGGRLSPVVRRLIEEHGLDANKIQGTGGGGRITRQDVLAQVDKQSGPAQATPGIAGKMVPHDRMRKSIASHMVDSLLRTAPHVTAVFEMDMSAVMAHRKANKQAFADQGVHLTFTSYFVQATVAALKAVPQVNSRFHEDALEVFDDLNIGVGTALEDKGLIVPVIHKAQDLDLLAISQRLQDLTTRARDGKLTSDDVQRGTFTISNHGVSGSLIATPIIINQPQSAILGIGKLEKRVVVEEVNGEDLMVVKPMAFVTLSIDHRVLDAYHTNAFLTRFVEVIEGWEL